MPNIQIPPLNLAHLDISSPEASPPPSNPYRTQFVRPNSAESPMGLQRLPLTPTTLTRGTALVQRLSEAFDPAVRMAGWGQRYSDAGDYATKFWEAAVLEASRFHARPTARFVDLLDGLAQRRRAIATTAQDPMSHLFGRWRNSQASDGLMTPIGGVYATDRSVRAFLPRFLADDKADIAQHLRDESSGGKPFWTILGRLHDGTTAELTSWEGVSGFPRWWHATPTPAIMAHLQVQFHAAWTHPSDDSTGLVRRVASLQWWLAHACIFARGSAGISDMVATCVLWHHGYKRPRPRPDISVDLAAFCSPSESAFIARYPSLFEAAPVPFGPLTERDAQALRGLKPV